MLDNEILLKNPTIRLSILVNNKKCAFGTTT